MEMSSGSGASDIAACQRRRFGAPLCTSLFLARYHSIVVVTSSSTIIVLTVCGTDKTTLTMYRIRDDSSTNSSIDSSRNSSTFNNSKGDDSVGDKPLQGLSSALSGISLNSTDSEEKEDAVDNNSYTNDGSDEERLGFDDDSMIGVEIEHTDTREELVSLTVAQLKAKLVERGLIQSGNKAALIERLLDPQPADFKKKPTVQPWKTSRAKELLIRFLQDETSPFHLLSPNDAWESSEWFMQYPKERFIDNMKNLKAALAARNGIVKNDNITIAAELAKLASLDLSEETLRGYPLWHLHDASKLLEEDLKNNRKGDMGPAEFQQTRPEYCEFPDFVFRKHIYQENRKVREMPMKIAKRNKLADKKYREEVDEEFARWKVDNEYDDDVNEVYELTRA